MKSTTKTSGLVAMIWNRLNRKEIYSRADYWDAKAVEYTHNAVSMCPNNHINGCYTREQVAMLDSYRPDLAGKAVLDLGCGTGRISRYLAGRGATVLGMDFSANSIDLARGLSPAGNPSYEIRSIFDLDQEARHDTVVVFGVVTVACKTREELLGILMRVRRALKAGGSMVVIEPVHGGFLSRVLALPLDGFLATLSEAGFTVEHIRPLHFWPMRLVLSYVRWPRSITRVGYAVGQVCMRLLGTSSGDYKAILAVPSGERA